MIKFPSRAALHPVPKVVEPDPAPAPEAKPEVSDVVNAALESLAQQVQATSRAIQIMAESQNESGKSPAVQVVERKQPIRLEADIVRDIRTGRMEKIIITPVHDE